MKNIAIFGAGGFGREVACLLRVINEKEPTWNFIGFFDDGKEKGSQNDYGIVLGGIKELNCVNDSLAIVIAIGNPLTLEIIYNKIENNNISYPNIVADSVRYADKKSLFLGKGNIISHHCGLSCNVNVGNFNVFNADVKLGHDVIMGNFNSLMPGVRISGEVKIGDCNFFGVNSIVLQQNKIGNQVTLGAGSVLMRKPKDGTTYIGNPALKFKY